MWWFHTVLISLFLLSLGSNINCDEVWLPDVKYLTNRGSFVDVSLNKIDRDEKCFYNTPKNRVQEDSKEGIAIQEKSDFVSCRAIIGPMREKLFGNWTICGESEINQKSTRRCQEVNISWISNNNPDSTWVKRESHDLNYAVNIGGTLSTKVKGSGDAEECHAITPKGEDLLLQPTSKYPGITASISENREECLFELGPIDFPLLGNWTLYGRFKSMLDNDEVHRKVFLYFYDNENPVNKPYNVENNELINYTVHTGYKINVQVKNKGDLDSCYVKTPQNKIYFKNVNESTESNVAFHKDKKSCNVTVYISEQMHGNWTLVGKFSDGIINTEIRQNFNVFVKKSPKLICSNVTVMEGETAILSCKIEKEIYNCYFKSPNGTTYHVDSDENSQHKYVGKGFHVGECGISFPSLRIEDGGRWSCHVGLNGENEEEIVIDVNVKDLITLDQYVTQDEAIIEGVSYPGKYIEYCTFVRNDGLGFTKFNLLRHSNKCEYRVTDLTPVDTQLWSVLAKIEKIDKMVLKVARLHVLTHEKDFSYSKAALFGLLCMLMGISMYTTVVLIKNKLFYKADKFFIVM